MNFYPPPEVITAEIYYEVPASLRCFNESTEWSQGFYRDLNGVFLEGPVVDCRGRLYVVDIPFGRILRIDENKNVTCCARWDGEPNGLAIRHDGKILIADYKQVGYNNISRTSSESKRLINCRG